MYDLPSEDAEEPGLPDEFHEFQPQLLRETCQPTVADAEPIFIGTDLNLYYDSRHTGWYKRPDWFLVSGVEPAIQQSDLRLSYVTWQEGINPFLVVELLSPGTEADDLGDKVRELGKPPTKWDVYERILRVPFYVVFDRYENRLRVFRLEGNRYRLLELSEPRFWLEELGIGLGLWQGQYAGVEGLWLRWYGPDGAWVLTTEDVATEASSRAERLAAKLRELGVDPNSI